ncbi:uncharacterized protein LOC119691537 isoform X2 [Plutella xylostella]|uniref:uncharacterized protein LOC119691537 isoform X2 n=1 Tax=Plutella xylostella TaxID=51655 RepID=UPI002032361F|nr:uncharacterized protein LOC119691537 isoform X2 [Plutella xylostella]
MMIPTCLVKILELMLSVACVALLALSYDLTDPPSLLLAAGTYGGYVIVLSGEIIGELTFAPLDLVQDMYLSALGAVLFATSGGMTLAARLQGDAPRAPRTGDAALATAGGGVALAAAALLALDLVLAYLDSEEYDEEASV